MTWETLLRAVLTRCIAYLHNALFHLDQATRAVPNPKKDSDAIMNADVSPSQSGPMSDELRQPPPEKPLPPQENPLPPQEKPLPAQEKPLGLLHSICVQEKGKPNRWFYSAKQIPGLEDYMEEGDDNQPALFEIQYGLKGTSKEGAAIKTMKKKDFNHLEDFINLEKDFSIETQQLPMLSINARGVISAFRYLIKYDPYQSMAGDKMTLWWNESWNYPSWYHKKLVELQKSLSERRPTEYVPIERAKDLTNDDTANQIGQLLNIMRPYLDKYVSPEWEFHSMSPPLATFERLWLLFMPGERVYTKVGGELAGFIVTSIRYKIHDENSRTRNAGKKMMHVSIWNYRFIGGKVVRHRSEVSIEEFKEQREITVLPIFPSSVYDKSDDGELRRKLEARGRDYYKLIKIKFSHKEYHGRTLDSKPVEYHGDIIIDPVTYAKLHDTNMFYNREREKAAEALDVSHDPFTLDSVAEPQDFGGGELWKDYDDFDPSVDRKCPLDERHFFLFPKKICGMSLKDKQWSVYDIDAVTDIEWPAPDDAMKQVTLSDEQESLLLANCRDEKSVQLSPDWVADPARQKGAGKLFLLHGPPGTGKTLTVDCIAKYLKQPVLSLSVADIGTMESESNLERWLGLAMSWNAIVLIDEADVFMTHRGLSRGHLKDIVLVSTFLRAVEFYTGIMFLTTNRPGQMDMALHSRVQVPIRYDYLTINDRKNICRSLFAKFKNTGPWVKYEQHLEESLLKDEIMDFQLNARELRNAFQQAVALARENSVCFSGGIRQPSNEIKLTLAELRRAFKVRQDYNQGIKDIHDMDSSALAHGRSELPPKSTTDNNVPDANDHAENPQPTG